MGCVLSKLLFSLKFSVFSLIMWLVSLVTIPLYLQISTLMSSKIIPDISWLCSRRIGSIDLCSVVLCRVFIYCMSSRDGIIWIPIGNNVVLGDDFSTMQLESLLDKFSESIPEISPWRDRNSVWSLVIFSGDLFSRLFDICMYRFNSASRSPIV